MSKIAELEFTDKNLEERWDRVKEDFWCDLKGQTLKAVKRALETMMEIEVQDLIGSPKWKHTATRPTYRNGKYFRSLFTSLGFITRLEVPRVRSGRVNFKAFNRYMRRTKDVDAAVLGIFLAGVSTRRVKETLLPLFGENALSATTVSKISKVLNSWVTNFHNRKIDDDYVYIILDGIYLKAKSPVSSRRRCILVVYGIRSNGIRELIDFRVVRSSESQIAWECFLTSLMNRGLKGQMLKLASVDGNRGLWNALDLVWPDIKRQRCWAHKLRNVANHLPKKMQNLCLNQARDIYSAASYTEAIKAFRHWVKIWKPISPKAVVCLEQDIDDLLQFFHTPKPMWVKIRTTNIIERVFREVRRRTRPMSCFSNVQSLERIIYAILLRPELIYL